MTTMTKVAMRLMARAELCEFWTDGDQVWRRGVGSYVRDVWGRPADLRWECSLPHWERCRATSYAWAKDVTA